MTLLEKKPKPYRADTPMALERMAAICSFLRTVESGTIPQISDATGIGRDAMRPNMTELTETGVIEVVGTVPGTPARLYRFVADLPFAPDTHPPRQCRVPAADWKRGEHAGAVGVPVFFPRKG